MGAQVSNYRSAGNKPNKTFSRKFIKKDQFTFKKGKNKGKTVNVFRMSIPMDDGTTLSLSILADNSGKVMIDKDKKGNSVVWADCAEFDTIIS